MGGAFRLKWVGQLWQSELLFFGRYAQKNTGLQGSTLSGPRMTTGFGPFELPTRGLLQKGRDHSPPKFCFVRSPAFWLVQLLLGAFRVYKFWLAILSCWWSVWEACSSMVGASVSEILLLVGMS